MDGSFPSKVHQSSYVKEKVSIGHQRASIRLNGDKRAKTSLGHNRVLVVFLCFSYFLALTWLHENVVSVTNGYFPYIEISGMVFLALLFLATLPSLWLPTQLRYPSQVCYWTLYLCVIVPSTFLPFHVLRYRSTLDIFALPIMLVAMFGLLGLFYQLPTFSIRKIKVNQRTLFTALVFAATTIIAVAVVMTGFHFTLALDDDYSRRMSEREMVVGGSLLSYALATLSHTLGPLLVAIGYVRKNWIMLTVGIIGLLCIFSMGGHKASLFTPVFLLALFPVVSYWRRSFGVVLVLGMTVLVALAALQFQLLDQDELSNYLIRRQIFVPALLTSFYWDFFSQNEYVYFSDSFLRYVVERPYDLHTSRLIGEEYLGDFECNANANVWATGFAHFGYLGMIVTTILLGFLFRLIDSLAMKSDFFVSALMCGMFSIAWSNGGLHTSFISYGILFSLLCIFLLAPVEKPLRRKSKRLHGGALGNSLNAPLRQST